MRCEDCIHYEVCCSYWDFFSRVLPKDAVNCTCYVLWSDKKALKALIKKYRKTKEKNIKDNNNEIIV